MPVAQFVPIIGSGFDQTAAQQFQWQQFNRQQDADNFARANAAQHDYNNYLLQLNQLQRQDVATADQYAEHADTLAYNRALQAANMAERARQFDINTELAEQQWEQDWRIQNAAETAKAAEQERQEAKYLDEIAQAAENIAPEYNSTRKAVDELQSKALAQQRAVLKSAGDILAGLPEEDRGKITYNGKRFVPVPALINDQAALATANLADAQMADVVSDYAETTKALEFQQKYLADLTKQIGQYRLQVTKDKDDYFLVSPLHKGKKFGKILEEAKAKTTVASEEPVPFIPSGVVGEAQAAFRLPTPDEQRVAAGFTTWNTPPAVFGNAPIPRAAFVPTEFLTQTPTATPAEAAPEGPAPIVFQPDRVSTMRTLRNAPGVLSRGVSEFLAGPRGPQASRGFVPFARQVMQAAIGEPERWLEPVKSDRVRVLSPDGVIGTIPKSQLEESIKLGYKRFQ